MIITIHTTIELRQADRCGMQSRQNWVICRVGHGLNVCHSACRGGNKHPRQDVLRGAMKRWYLQNSILFSLSIFFCVSIFHFSLSFNNFKICLILDSDYIVHAFAT
jgi:hypothetical protein